MGKQATDTIKVVKVNQSKMKRQDDTDEAIATKWHTLWPFTEVRAMKVRKRKNE